MELRRCSLFSSINHFQVKEKPFSPNFLKVSILFHQTTSSSSSSSFSGSHFPLNLGT